MKAGYKQTEAGVIPEDWDVLGILEVADFFNGKPYEKNIKDGGQYFLITLDSIDIDGYLKKDHKQIDILDGSLKKGDLVTVLSDLAHGNLLGLCDLIPEDDRYVLNQRMGCIRIKSEAIPLYLRSQINTRQHHFKIRGQGTSQKHIYKKDFATLRIPFPNHEEQRAITTVICDIEALVDSLGSLITKKRNFKQAAMQQLLTGQTRLAGFDGVWEIKIIGEIAEIVSGGTPSTRDFLYWNGDIKWCTPTDITRCQAKYINNTERKITNLGLSKSGAKLLPPGTLLLCSRATIGEVRIALTAITTNQGFKSLICKPGINNEFVYYKLLTMKQQMIDRSFGSTFLEISKANVAALELEIPPEEEQAAIAAVLSDMDNEIEALEQRRDKTRALKQGMMQELLTGRTRLI